MNRMIDNFMKRLDNVKDEYEWSVDGRFGTIRGERDGKVFCVLGAVLYEQRGDYLPNEKFLVIGSMLRLLPRDVNVIVDSTDGHGEKFSSTLRSTVYHSLFGRKENSSTTYGRPVQKG